MQVIGDSSITRSQFLVYESSVHGKKRKTTGKTKLETYFVGAPSFPFERGENNSQLSEVL